MKRYASYSACLLAVTLAAALFPGQPAFAAGCDLPMFAGGRLFAAVGDLSGDGNPDLAVTDFGGGAADVALLLGNGDGQPDLVFADTIANTLVVLLNSYIPGSSVSACPAVQPLGN